MNQFNSVKAPPAGGAADETVDRFAKANSFAIPLSLLGAGSQDEAEFFNPESLFDPRVAARIRTAREGIGMKVDEVGRAVGVPSCMIRTAECEPWSVSLGVLGGICRVLGISPRELVGSATVRVSVQSGDFERR